MGLFNFVSGWKRKLIDEPLDRKMRQTADVGLETARANVHVITGHLKASIGSMYNQQTKTVMLYADAKYALIEEMRGPTRNYQQHHYLLPAAKAMGQVWGGNFEIHLPNVVPAKGQNLANVRKAEVRLHQMLGSGRGSLGQRTRIAVRRWHKRAALIPGDPTTPLV